MRASDIIGKFRFRRSSDGGSGGVSDEVKGSVITLGEQLGASWSGPGYNPYPLSSYSIRIPIDENNCIAALLSSNKITGLMILPVQLEDGVLNLSQNDTIDLNLGDNAPTGMLTPNQVKIAEDKSFVIFGVSGVNKFFYIPLNKVNNSYTFGTPIELDLDVAVYHLVIMDANTFVIHQWSSSHKLSIIKLSNGSLSIERTINERQINDMNKVGDKLVILSDMKFAVYNVTTGERIYLASRGVSYNFMVIGNKAIGFDTGYGIEVNGDNIQFLELNTRSNAWKYYLIEKIDDSNYLIIYNQTDNNKQIEAFIFDYQNNLVKKDVKILNNIFITASNYGVLVRLAGILILGDVSGSEALIYQSEIINNKIVSLKYQNNTYNLTELGE